MNYYCTSQTFNQSMSTKPTTQSEAVIYYIQEMDLEMVELILEDDKTYQDVSKSTFIETLGNVFNIFRHNKNTKLVGHPGFCNSDICPNACKGGYSFVGNHSKHRIDIIMEVKKGNVMDIFQCHDLIVFNKEIVADDYHMLDLNTYGNRTVWDSSDDSFDIF